VGHDLTGLEERLDLLEDHLTGVDQTRHESDTLTAWLPAPSGVQ